MIIKKVTLKNYRNHSSKEIILDKGINLIIGQNGAGKSSIVEALGIALFNAEPRNGLTGEAVSKGENSALIVVRFIGNDENEYVIERKIGSGGYARLYVEGEDKSRFESINDVYSKMRELAGITANEKNIFQNVITASQNKFVNIFLDVASTRDKTFNEIFDTEIYRNMSNGYVKSLIQRYEGEIAQLSAVYEEKIKSVSDGNKLAKELENLSLEIIRCEKKIRNGKEQYEKLKSEREQFLVKKNQISECETSIKHIGITISNLIEERKRAESELDESKNSIKIIEENKENYIRYEDLSAKFKNLQGEIKALEKIKDNYEKLSKESSNLENSIIEYREKINGKSAMIEEKRSDIVKRKGLLSEQEKLCHERKSKNDKRYDEIEKNKDINTSFSGLYKKITEAQSEVRESEIKIRLAEEKLTDGVKLNFDIKELENKRVLFTEKMNLKKTLQSEIDILRHRLKDNNEAKLKLLGGVCPFLKDQCYNIKEGGDSGRYFNQKETEFNEQLEVLNGKLEKFKNIDEENRENENAIMLLRNCIREGDENRRIIDENRSRITLNLKDIEIMNLKLKELLFPVFPQFVDSIDKKEYERTRDFLIERFTTLNAEYKLNESEIYKSNKEISDKRRDIVGEERFIENITNEIEELNHKIGLHSNKKDLLDKEIIIQKEQFSPLEDKKRLMEKINNEITSLKGSYDLYMQNISKADEFKKRVSNLKDCDEKIFQFEEKLSSLNNNLANLKFGYSGERFELVQNQIMMIEGEIEKSVEERSFFNNQSKNKTEEIERNNALMKECEYLNKKIENLKAKYEVSKKFREKLNDMGKLVASRLLEKIEELSTLNFRNITGRGEEIHWINNEDESYAVYLKLSGETGKGTRFDILSGGEQVAVALSIRAAMASLFTKTDMAIFDEPTINLDAERKVSLAENLTEILKNLKQAIIITHDDTFREMAQNVINL